MAQLQSNSQSCPTQPLLEAPSLWEYGQPLIGPRDDGSGFLEIPKDPSIVYFRGRWHLFMTLKQRDRTTTAYCSFARWEEAQAAPWTVLRLADTKYYCAPQVFYFEPHKLWYLIYQVGGMSEATKMWVACSTTTDLADPASWTPARPILDGGYSDPRPEGGLDYWVICDPQRAYLYFTSLNGKLWRGWTTLEEFPCGFQGFEVALTAEIYEASHTYKLRGLNQYLTIIEQDHRRYYKAYLADRLDGPWIPLADTEQRPFAGAANVRPAPGVPAWTDNVSHGELIREGCDQSMTIDPQNLQFLFQGMLERDKSNKGYGQFEWSLGLLTPVQVESRANR